MRSFHTYTWQIITLVGIDETRHKYNASVAEVDTQDKHQILILGIAIVSGTLTRAQTVMEEVIRYMEESTDAEIISVEKEIV